MVRSGGDACRPDFTRSVKPMLLSNLILQLAGGMRATVPALVLNAGPFAKTILAILLVLSVYSWAVIANRLRLYSRVEKADRIFLASFRKLSRGGDFRLICEQHPESLL